MLEAGRSKANADTMQILALSDSAYLSQWPAPIY